MSQASIIKIKLSLFPCRMNGQLSHAVTLPDTITTWMVSAFAINDEGLAVGRGPTEVI